MFFRCHRKVQVVHPDLVGLFYTEGVNNIYNSSNSRGSKFISGIPKESLLKIGLNSAVKQYNESNISYINVQSTSIILNVHNSHDKVILKYESEVNCGYFGSVTLMILEN